MKINAISCHFAGVLFVKALGKSRPHEDHHYVNPDANTYLDVKIPSGRDCMDVMVWSPKNKSSEQISIQKLKSHPELFELYHAPQMSFGDYIQWVSSFAGIPRMPIVIPYDQLVKMAPKI